MSKVVTVRAVDVRYIIKFVDGTEIVGDMSNTFEDIEDWALGDFVIRDKEKAFDWWYNAQELFRVPGSCVRLPKSAVVNVEVRREVTEYQVLVEGWWAQKATVVDCKKVAWT